MKRHVYRRLLVAATLLLTTLGCTKKNEPAPNGTGQFLLDGRIVECQVSASRSFRATAGQQVDYLLVTMQATPVSATSELTRIEFSRPAGQPTADYNLVAITYYASSASGGLRYTNATTASLGVTSPGAVSGYFIGSEVDSTTHLINGLFRDVPF